MADLFKSTLKLGWLFVTAWLLILPILYPSYDSFSAPIRTSTLGMFILSFPSSLIAMPMAYVSSIGLGFQSGSLATNYMILLLVALAGFIQWFWLVPIIFQKGADLQRLDLSDAAGNRRLFRPSPETYSDWFDAAGTSPLEHAMRDDD